METETLTSPSNDSMEKMQALKEAATAKESGEVKPKNKGGRPKGSGKKQPETSPQASPGPENPFAGTPTVELTKPLMIAVSSLGVAYAGHPQAGMTPEQTDMCAQALAGLLDKYLPDMGNKYGAEMLFCLAFGSYGLHVHTVKKQVDAAKAAAARKAREEAALQGQNQTPQSGPFDMETTPG